MNCNVYLYMYKALMKVAKSVYDSMVKWIQSSQNEFKLPDSNNPVCINVTTLEDISSTFVKPDVTFGVTPVDKFWLGGVEISNSTKTPDADRRRRRPEFVLDSDTTLTIRIFFAGI